MSISTVINKRLKKYLFIQEVNRIKDNPQALIENQNDILQRLVYLWGNEGWSGLSDYLKACLEYTKNSKGCVIECGSGLSTILMGIIAKSNNIKVISLENSGKWRKRTNWYLKKFNLDNSSILYSPIVSKGEFQWYSIEEKDLPTNVSLVILDGPPADIIGGRSGFFKVCKNLLNKDSVVLVDDVVRKPEMDMVIKFSSEMNFSYNISQGDKPFATMIKN